MSERVERPDLNDPGEHWVNNPLISPLSKVANYERAIRLAKAEAWDEGNYCAEADIYEAGWDGPRSPNPYRSEQ